VAIDVDGGVLWLGFFRGVRVVGGGGFGRFVVFLALGRASGGGRVSISVAAGSLTETGVI